MIDWELAEFGVFRVTDYIYVGEYPKNATFQRLTELGVARILNVSGCHYQHAAFDVTNIPVIDLAEIPLDTAVQLANTIVDCVKNNQKVFVHCVAGQNRSPAAVFLGLIALGYSIEDAEKLISENTQDS